MSERGCYMTVDWSARYNRCQSCGFVRRAWWGKPLLHKGGKPR